MHHRKSLNKSNFIKINTKQSHFLYQNPIPNKKMAYHYNHHCHRTIPTPTPTYHCCCSSSTATISHHPPPPPPPPEPLIIQCQSIHSVPPPQPPKSHHKLKHQNQENEQEESTLNPMISSLLRRITALESTIRRHSSSSSSFSLRHAAAQTIQTHFRAFLVRRSQTLRQLKQLAYIKSALNSLKSTHSNNSHSDSRALSLKATALLRKLDLIQGGDPMIRDGKRSIKRELVRFTDYLDELSFKRYQLSSVRIDTKSRVSKNGEKELLEKLRKKLEKLESLSGVCDEDEEEDVVELENARTRVKGKAGGSQVRNGVLAKRHSGFQVKAKKNVSFAEDGNVYVVYKGNGAVCDSECDRFDGSDLVDAEELGSEVKEIGNGDDDDDYEEEANSDDDELSESSDDDGGSRRNVVAESDSMDDPIEKEDRSFVFYAPLPVKMESRRDLMNKKMVKRTN